MNATTIEDTVLVIVDVQGKLATLMAGRESLFHKIGIIIQAARRLAIPVVWCEQAPRALGPTVPEVACHLDGLTPLPKTTFSCWGDPHFRQEIQSLGRREVLICGIETHICVFQTARDLRHHGFGVHVLSDAVSSRSIDDRDLALCRMEQEGVRLCCLEMVLFDLLKDARHPEFKAIASLIK